MEPGFGAALEQLSLGTNVLQPDSAAFPGAEVHTRQPALRASHHMVLSAEGLCSAPPDRGIIMTFGSGSNGCLGHGNFTDVTQVCGVGTGAEGKCWVPRVWQLVLAKPTCSALQLLPALEVGPGPSPSLALLLLGACLPLSPHCTMPPLSTGLGKSGAALWLLLAGAQPLHGLPCTPGCLSLRPAAAAVHGETCLSKGACM